MRQHQQPWPLRVETARARLLRAGHIEPVVAVTTPAGRFAAGNPDQRFEVGSVTKLFTALLLAEMAQAGAVSLDDRVPAFLPAGTRLAPGVADITLASLACHRSGLPRLPPGMLARSFSRSAMNDPYADLDAERLIASLARTKVRGTAGEARFRYSNYGMGLLGFLLGRATGAGYEASLAQHVLQPLQMDSSTFEDHDLHQGRRGTRPVGPWHLAALAGAGGLRSSASDLLTFAEAVRDGTGPLQAAIACTLQPRGRSRGMQVGLGWLILGEGGLLMHDGGTLGARSEIRIERRTGTAAVVLADGRRGTAAAVGSLLSPAPSALH